MSGFDWVYCCNFTIPPNAVKCGNDLDGSDIFVGLANYQRDELPCKIIPRRREAYVCYDGKEIRVNDFKILCEKRMYWILARDGQVPAGAIPAGRTSLGEILYIGRVNTGGVTKVGKVHPSHNCLYVPYDGKEVSHKAYEILVLR
ncbi:natterin-4 [Tribolium castaneum]|uniref:Uncharacterized protein n=1 Tax=Tribolium castaneum TaxID=7070 RepID=A0A139WDQ7_TRICA|nr:PREDICTED: natterin-4-like isoform X2 [Tribolium castaneum]KYB26098.1 hypothetical protein TcasGA2_TC033967 [Tribolium castaneum]|eukprot:XP_008196172.1 PREDICTED: natterin-4-like isoform X2 [Tribolium castaneum]